MTRLQVAACVILLAASLGCGAGTAGRGDETEAASTRSRPPRSGSPAAHEKQAGPSSRSDRERRRAADAGPDGAVSRGDGGTVLRFEVKDAKSTCMKDEDCIVTRYPGCCCSTVDSAMPRSFAISKADLEAREQWCEDHVERIECDVSRCPPATSEQPAPAEREASCVDRRCVSAPVE